jgi:RNA polymerase sigma factor (sigma-70 family)
MARWTEDTDIGGEAVAFPRTPASAVLGVRADDPVARGRAFATLVAAYWKPVYKHLRLRFRKGNEDAKDLTQAFFANALERGAFSAFATDRGRFRTFVRACLRNFVLNEEAAGKRLKRGGAADLSVDFDAAELELSADDDPEALFDRDLVRTLESLAVRELEGELAARGKQIYFDLFSRYYLADEEERPTYAALAEETGLKATDVTNHLAFTRKRLRAITLTKLREITASEDEFRDEARELLGVPESELG